MPPLRYTCPGRRRARGVLQIITHDSGAMQHISDILAGPAPPARSAARWQRAAEAALAIARVRTTRPASLRQLRRVCQLLMSRAVGERERRRAFVVLTQGCTQEKAGAMLAYLIPRVQAREAEDARAFLEALLRRVESSRTPNHSRARPR